MDGVMHIASAVHSAKTGRETFSGIILPKKRRRIDCDWSELVKYLPKEFVTHQIKLSGFHNSLK
jgi:hypothetical protein